MFANAFSRWWRNKSSSLCRPRGASRRRGIARPLVAELLESRTLLTTTLYIDYGDRFPSGVLNTTVGALDSTVSGKNPNIDGAILKNAGNKNYATNATVAITSVNNLYGMGAAALRGTMTALTQRFFQPLDITVVELTAAFQSVNGFNARAAASLADISRTLGLNEGVSENNDAYLIVGQFVINGTDNPATFAMNGYGGLAPGTDIGRNNNNDGTAYVLLAGTGDGAQFNGAQIAHEAGHLFGLQHAYRQNTNAPPPAISNTTATGAQYDVLQQSELMSYLGYATQGGFNVFSRYPMMRGDGNTDANRLVSSPTPFDQMRNDPNIGSSNMEYVTGTGTHDIITVRNNNNGTANVSVQAFADAAYSTTIDAPGATGNTYSYNINLNRPLLIDAGGNNDRIVLDGNLGVTITVRGMHGTDELIVMGKNVSFGSYTPGTNTPAGPNTLDGNDDVRGTVVVDGTTINFQEFDPGSKVTVQDVGNFTLRTPRSTDNVVVAPVPGSSIQNQISGTSNGTAFVPLTFFNVGSFTLDTGIFDGSSGGSHDDVVSMTGDLQASGLQNFTVTTGSGDDVLQISTNGNFFLPVSGGAFRFQGGSGSDQITATAISLGVGFGLSDASLDVVSNGGGSLSLTSVEQATLIGNNITNIFAVANWSGTAVLDGLGGSDLYTIEFQGSGGGTVQISDSDLVSGTDFATINATTGSDRLTVSNNTVRSGGDAVSYSGLESLTINALGGNDRIDVQSTFGDTPVTVNGGDDDDTIHVGAPSNSLGGIQSLLTVSGNDPSASDALILHDEGETDPHTYQINVGGVFRDGTFRVSYDTVESLTLNAGVASDTIDVKGTSASTAVIVNAGAGDDTINVYDNSLSLAGIQGALTVNGNDHIAGDLVKVFDTSENDSRIYTITQDSLDRDGAATINYFEMEGLELSGGQGGNSITVQETDPRTAVTIRAGAGHDVIAVDSNLSAAGGTVDEVRSSLTVDGQGGSNFMTLEDSGDPTGDVVHVTPTQIGAHSADNFFGPGGSLAYSNVAGINIHFGFGPPGDTVHVTPSAATYFNLVGNVTPVMLATASTVLAQSRFQPAEIDTLLLDFTDVTGQQLTASGDGSGTWTFTNRQLVSFSGFEKLNHVGIIVVTPDVGGSPEVRVFDAETGAAKFAIDAYDESFRGGVRVAVGDVNADGIPDIITAPGSGHEPLVKVFNGATGLLYTGDAGSFLAFDQNFLKGVWVAAGDVNRDGFADIITGKDAGSTPQVRVYDGLGSGLIHEFNAYGSGFRGGVRVAAGDINGDGGADIITAPGPGRVPEVRVFRGTDANQIAGFRAFENSFKNGVYVAAGDVNGDGQTDIIASGGNSAQRFVRVFNGAKLSQMLPSELASPYSPQTGDSVRIAAVDADADGKAEVVVAPPPSALGKPKVFKVGLTPTEIDNFFAGTISDSTLGFFVGAGT